jgi:hypothetical protein
MRCMLACVILWGRYSPLTLVARKLTQCSRQRRRLRDLGLLTRGIGTYRDDLTRGGRAVIVACCRLTAFLIVPTLANT